MLIRIPGSKQAPECGGSQATAPATNGTRNGEELINFVVYKVHKVTSNGNLLSVNNLPFCTSDLKTDDDLSSDGFRTDAVPTTNQEISKQTETTTLVKFVFTTTTVFPNSELPTIASDTTAVATLSTTEAVTVTTAPSSEVSTHNEEELDIVTTEGIDVTTEQENEAFIEETIMINEEKLVLQLKQLEFANLTEVDMMIMKTLLQLETLRGEQKDKNEEISKKLNELEKLLSSEELNETLSIPAFTNVEEKTNTKLPRRGKTISEDSVAQKIGFVQQKVATVNATINLFENLQNQLLNLLNTRHRFLQDASRKISQELRVINQEGSASNSAAVPPNPFIQIPAASLV